MRNFRITLSETRFHCRHGVFTQETMVGNDFIVDCSVEYPAPENGCEDNLARTVSYADLYEIVSRNMKIPRKLLETVAESIAEEITEKWPFICSGEITITKSVPPIAGMDGSAKVTLFF